MLAVVACSKADDKKSAGSAAPDPWAANGWVGRIGSNGTGAYIHIGANNLAMPTQTVRFNEHICYRQ